MKTLFAAAVLAAAIISPAAAQQTVYRMAASEVVTGLNGVVLGRDADANVRLDLKRNAERYSSYNF